MKQIEANFTRDVMMPLGLPIVSSYHAMREHFFLNTKVKNGLWVESVGNFFLTPSRYLFNGRTIQLEDLEHDTYAVRPSFHYHKLHWFKTLISLIALPVGEVLGTTFKALSYLWPEVRRRNRALKRSLATPIIRSHLAEYHKLGLPQLHCEASIPCLAHKRPSELLKRQKIEIEALKEVAALLDAHKIVWWIDCGTCLGAYRYGGIIPWDWDIDISILLPDHENVKRVLSQLDPEKYQIQDWSSYQYPNSYLKLYLKETQNFLDIYHYAIDAEKKEVGYFFTFKDSPFPYSWKVRELQCVQPVRYDQMFPLKRAQFDGVSVWAPNDVVAFLQSKNYGENLEPTKVWDEETKSYKKVEGHPYYLTQE